MGGEIKIEKEVNIMSTAVATAAGDFDPVIQDIGDRIVSLTVLQAMALGRYIREVHGIEPESYGVQIETAPLNKYEDAVPLVGVYLVKVADQTKKIAVIKVIREVTGLGLAESKAVVDKAPHIIKAKIMRDDAENIAKLIEQAGGTVEIK